MIRHYARAALYPSLFILLASFAYCVLCTPIFLNRLDFVRRRPALRLLSWFLLPLAYWAGWAVLLVYAGPGRWERTSFGVC